MKIAYLCNIYPRVTHTFIRREIDGLEKERIEVERISIRRAYDPMPTPGDVEEQQRTFVVLECGVINILFSVVAVFATRPFTFLHTLWQALAFGRRSKAGLLKHIAYFVESCVVLRHCEKKSVVHNHAHFGTNAAMIALLVYKLNGPSYSIMIHGPGEWDCPEFLHLPQKVENAVFVAAISFFAKSQTYKWTNPSHWEKVHVIRCGVDQDFLASPITDVPDVPRLVMIGRMGRSKGHIILLEAMQSLVSQGVNCHVKLIGDGPLRQFVQEQVIARGLGDHVELVGWMDNNLVRQELIDSRAMVLPSFAEGLPVVLMEALALARPVITTRIAGISELVVDGENGWLVNSGSVEELAKAIREVINKPVSELSIMGLAGRQAVMEKHDALVESRKLAELFRRYADNVEARV